MDSTQDATGAVTPPPAAMSLRNDSTVSHSHGITIESRLKITEGWQCVVSTPIHHTRNSSMDDSAVSVDLERGDKIRAVMGVSFEPNISTKEELQAIKDVAPLPQKPASRTWRFLRWNFFSVYRKAFAFVLTANLVAIVIFLVQLRNDTSIANYQNAATAASANFLAAILIRNEHVINVLFWLACSLPVWTPLPIRRRAAKVYSYGGIHSACGLSGTVWYLVFAVLAMTQYPRGGPIEVALAVTTGITLMLLITILIFAYPTIRMKLHNHFEATHRYGGWCAILVLWIQTMLLVISNAQTLQVSFGLALIRSPPFWLLVIITALIIYPWTRLRSREVQVEKLSRHATRLHFSYTDLDTCMAIRLTDAPLMETHGFATIPNYSGSGKGYSVLVSNAGDWTSKIINNPPKRLWVKGAPTLGVMRVALMFRKVLIVATGSGIGPCLSLLQSYPNYPVRVLWSAQDPESTYGNGIIKSVFRSDPNAVIVDTRKTGRPDLLAIAYGMLVASECEAAVVISNPKVTKKVVYGLETRGIPAFGPIFDS
ncbi:hypothetical protein CAC42_3464 [Sphaceloma murrayae]|uniref:Integral membrane protein TmpA n=1 Tax=Sphaceloma murrayae TaxID=2082308 RepID=A0A2K1R1F4_9PEZI|nr:hypothetical protein CAC42_3464 [Sphaceloma murrayae]